uniref:PH domain-containing protein n=1 Tax=Macrostomum lignano TaxID=282301 RepID=A0A1I8G4Y3_9PLAT
RQKMRSEMAKLINTNCDELLGIWRRMGMTTQFQLESRLPVILGWVSDLMVDMVRGEAIEEMALSDSVTNKLAAARQLHSELLAELSVATAGAERAAMTAELTNLTPDRIIDEQCGLIQREQLLNQFTGKLHTMRLRLALLCTIAQMRTLWRRLQIDSPDAGRQYWESLAASQAPTHDTLRRMEAELSRLRQLVVPKLRECIADCRREIIELCDHCLAAPSELDQLRPLLDSQDWTEELLDRHEAEAARLRQRFDRHSDFYTCIADWQAGWNSLQTLLQRLKDPAVLNNRGGVLLRLEREKKRAQTVLTAKEAELVNLAASAAGQSSPLTVRGQAVEDFLSTEKHRAQAEKENEAKRRMEKHETTLRRELQFGSKPASPLQRRVIHNSSRMVCKSKIGCTGGRVDKKLLRRSLKRYQQVAQQQDGGSVLKDLPEKAIQHQQHHHYNPLFQPHDVSISSSYSAFQSGVGFRSSSVLPPSAVAAAAGGPISSGGNFKGPRSQCDSGLSSLANQQY